MRPANKPRGGMTLVEVMIALIIVSIVLLLGRALLLAAGDAGPVILRGATSTDRQANGARMLRELIGSIEVTPGSTEEFDGTATEAYFTSWCDVPRGWKERCSVALEAGPNIVASIDSGPPFILRKAHADAEFRYLSGGPVETWVKTWDKGISAPVAVGVLIGRDTLVLRVGNRW
jgi:prepilin-type N-terminal cleavage/methylation domain-containing protein